MYKRLTVDLGMQHSDVRSLIFSIPTSKIAYEFTRKFYEILDLDVRCIASDFTSYDAFVKIPRAGEQVEIAEIDFEKIFQDWTPRKSVKKTKPGEMYRFDVIVGNPPYQMDSSGDGTNSTALYDVFVKAAKDLRPSYLTMIIPSRWMASGFGLGDFRETMLQDARIRKLVDFAKMDSIFPGVDFEGGVCYFLWDRDNPGDCESTFVIDGKRIGPTNRVLNEYDVFVRDPRSLAILEKVEARRGESVSSLISSISPFGIPTNFKGYRKGGRQTGDLTLYMNEGGKRVQRNVDPSLVRKGGNLISGWRC